MPTRSPEDPPEPPVMPSFASLRDPRRRTAVDVLVAPSPNGRAAPGARATARPPEWSDLLLLGAHVARWSLRRVARLFGQFDLSEGSATLRR